MDIEQDSKKIDTIDTLSLDDLTVGEKFYFIKENNISSEGQIVTKYDNCFAVSIFSGQANYKPVAVNEQVNFIIANKSSAFNCSSQVLGCKLEDGFQLAVLSIPQITNKIERRKHPRLQIVTAVDYYNLPSFTSYKSITQVPALYFKKMKKTFTVDISKSGINLVTYKEDIIPKEGIISLPLEEKIDILASIIRIDFDETNNSFKTAYEFKDIKKDKWSLLNKFIDERLKKQS
jgi:c-di-GMP-binding flagellar brake protein YcgR